MCCLSLLQPDLNCFTSIEDTVKLDPYAIDCIKSSSQLQEDTVVPAYQYGTVERIILKVIIFTLDP